MSRLVTVGQLARLIPGLTEDKIRHYLKHAAENGLESFEAVYRPRKVKSVFIHIDRFERWFAGRG